MSLASRTWSIVYPAAHASLLRISSQRALFLLPENQASPGVSFVLDGPVSLALRHSFAGRHKHSKSENDVLKNSVMGSSNLEKQKQKQHQTPSCQLLCFPCCHTGVLFLPQFLIAFLMAAIWFFFLDAILFWFAWYTSHLLCTFHFGKRTKSPVLRTRVNFRRQETQQRPVHTACRPP